VSGLRADLDFASALLAAGFPHDCEELLSPLTTPYHGGLSTYVDDPEAELPATETALIERIRRLGERCDNAAEASLSDFRPALCTDKRPTDCWALDGPTDERTGCATVQRVSRRGRTTWRATAGPIVDRSTCCGLDTIAEAARRGKRYIRISGSALTHICGGGTASRSPDGIYELKKGPLKLVIDLSVQWH
jgi:hypothetical protein